MRYLKKWTAMLVLNLCVIFLIANVYRANSSMAPQSMTGQDVRGLERRISSVEQQLYSIVTSINRLEQSALSQRTPIVQPGASDAEMNLLRVEIRNLQLRVNEVECGLVKLDERTTTSVGRDARRDTAAKIADPCRLNPATPLRLSTRP